MPPTTSLAALASELQAVIQGSSTAAEYAQAVVGVSGSQLLIIPGAAGDVTVGPAPGDPSTASELQLGTRLAVRVRVNGAESIDDAYVVLPQ